MLISLIITIHPVNMYLRGTLPVYPPNSHLLRPCQKPTAQTVGRKSHYSEEIDMEDGKYKWRVHNCIVRYGEDIGDWRSQGVVLTQRQS